jgi:C1A family cysteine protease
MGNEDAAMSEKVQSRGMGWLPDYPDPRDFTAEKDDVSPKLKSLGQKTSIKGMLKTVGLTTPSKVSLPAQVDLTAWCSGIEDQEDLGSCTAQAGVGVVEYFERKAFGNYIDASRLFLYKVTRTLMHQTGDTGAFLRTTMGAMALFGVPPEEYWPYLIADFDREPSAFCYSFAQNFQAISYYRLDPPGTSRDELLARIKANLAGSLPSMFGFTVFESIRQAATSGQIPYPTSQEPVLGGHAIVTVGHDDNLKIKNSLPGGEETTGALLIRNSWGESWGQKGHGWLPYK